MNKISIDELNGFKIGHAQDFSAMTGCTVVICEDGAVCGVDVRGGSPGTRDTDALHPINNRSVVHAVLFSGGSSFGLDAAGGVMRFLEERKIGRDVGSTVVPNVCAAILFDLNCGDHSVRPDEKMVTLHVKTRFPARIGTAGITEPERGQRLAHPPEYIRR
jgi:L-aminopeptidase/D-esterase-like protein